MQIELMGCTSAGKSTLINGIIKNFQYQDIEVLIGDDFVLKIFRLHWIKGYFIRRLVGDLIALMLCLKNLQSNFHLYLFAARIIMRLPPKVNLIERVMIARNVLRNLGIYEIIQRQSSQQQVILLDEGTLHIAHYLFVHVAVEPNPQDLANFAKLIPLPDVVIYIQEKEAVLIERTLRRGHKRIPNISYEQVERFIKFAVATFDELVKFSRIKNRLLVVDAEQKIHAAQDDQNQSSLVMAVKLLQGGLNKVNKEHLELEGIITALKPQDIYTTSNINL
ncbi:hypothetical protein NIES2100_40460 [Calothrix sp. NIES-2100]|uniref:hypothetical protein n=1 Tax=Calothrix sp. NIES-2100 TaxID=1954172 RepID=UPI000B61008D|nr:hypothetical protein NIES2100_40460 [Calothrix sp. NIES-2100]